MRADKPLPEDIEARLGRLAAILSRNPEVAAAWLFGSRARGEASPHSDVDIAVTLTSAFDAGGRWRKRLDLVALAERELATEAIDLIVLEDSPSVLAQRALCDGRLLTDNDPRRRVESIESVFRRYLDEAPLRAELDRGLRDRVREGNFAR